MAINPVCSMEVDAKTAAAQSDYKGKTYYFCSSGCKLSFDRAPEKYLNQDSAGSGHQHSSYHRH